MKKIDALKEILGTGKVAYGTVRQEAMWCGGQSFVVQLNSHKSCQDIDNFVNSELLEDGWKVSEEVMSMLDFKFSEELTIEELQEILGVETDTGRCSCGQLCAACTPFIHEIKQRGTVGFIVGFEAPTCPNCGCRSPVFVGRRVGEEEDIEAYKKAIEMWTEVEVL